MKETKELKSLRSKVLKIVVKINGLGGAKADLLKELQKECPHGEVLTTVYNSETCWDRAEVCTGCGLHFSEIYENASGPGVEILRSLPKTVKKDLSNDEFKRRRKEIFEKFGL